jgi:DNA-binding transcriptional ArsR family regulator
VIDSDSAVLYASWFRALADPTRLRLVSLLAGQRQGMSVGALTSALAVAQSTVSHHLAILTGVRFVLCEQVGTSSIYRLNERCITCFPTAADIVMGRQAPQPPEDDVSQSPGRGRSRRPQRNQGISVPVSSEVRPG